MSMLVRRRRARNVRQRAAHVLELNGRVVDREVIAQQRVDLPQDGIAGRGRHVLNQHVAA
jgi:hypothetical protein